MAKKTKKVVEPQIEETFEEKFEETMVEETIVEEPRVRKRLKPSNEWEIKDRMYYLKGGKKPLSKSIKAADIYYFDKELGYERELKYCQNQKTSFVDEMKGDQRLEHIIFRSGSLFVPKEKTVLQKLLSLYHPHKDSIYYEFKPAAIAAEEIDVLEQQVEALRVVEALEASLATDSALLDEQELGALKAEIAKLVAVRESATTPTEIKAAIEAVDNASSEFAARRMDASIKKALQGQSVDEV